ncbi:hypothetical protein SteCoe_29874 [Stentor coeruleus]|uniref:Uncharacterized protein n=1 Tax=Stentor coeruleus TaxID=5963 RepID=A0A1R2B4V2_9CILI|nr:hypothetical protein SteCoe_29874 [Stentor coeruleus]
MQALVDRALVQDEVSKYKRLLFKRAYIGLGLAITTPFIFLLVFGFVEMGTFHRGFSTGAANVFLWHEKSARELYVPHIYEKDLKNKPFEMDQFR